MPLWRNALVALLCILTLNFPCILTGEKAAQPPVIPENPYIFTDESIRLLPERPAAAAGLRIRLLNTAGWTAEVERGFVEGELGVDIRPLGEGIHSVEIISAGGAVTGRFRFLALSPPAPLDESGRQAILRSLPLSGQMLLDGAEFRILVMGDSVTNTGDYAIILRLLLQRATGNRNIVIANRSYPGRSVDATVRNFERDAIAFTPHLGLLMYGLNDQICGVPIAAYLAQCEYIALRLRGECGADTVFLQPTPHIATIPELTRDGLLNAPDFVLRTSGFAGALDDLGVRLRLPVAQTFAAVWGRGGSDLVDSARAQIPLFPPHFRRKFESASESDTQADTIHPNSLGHLQIARAVYAAICDLKQETPLCFSAVTDNGADEGGYATLLRVRNTSEQPRMGRLEVYALEGAELGGQTRHEYMLSPGEETLLRLEWPGFSSPADTLSFSGRQNFAGGCPRLCVVDYSGGGSLAHHVPAPLAHPVIFDPRRMVLEPGGRYELLAQTAKETEVMAVIAHSGLKDTGRFPFVYESLRQGRKLMGACEVVYTRFASARAGEAEVDGALSEWEGHVWSPLGEPEQARWVKGCTDNRATPDDCYLHFSFKAGESGVYLALKAKGDIASDSFTLFFDPREADKLGEVGQYYWVSGNMRPDGQIQLRRGETSPIIRELRGVWRKEGDDTHLELFVPYSLFCREEWPAGGDMGFSLIWEHKGEAGTTRLLWAENGHPWNPLWYGVVRRGDHKRDELPVRIMIY